MSTDPSTKFAIEPPVEPMLAKLAEALPTGGPFLYEPKWDGFRAIVFRDASGVFIQSRDLRPLDRYFPELHEALLHRLPDGCVVDGEIVIATPRGLDFDALQLRLHPAASRVAKLAKETPAEFVAFDVLAVDGRDVRGAAQGERRVLLEELLSAVDAPAPSDADDARSSPWRREWLSRFEGAGLDGVVAKPEHGLYMPGKRAMIKVKHARTADCVVAGFRWHKAGPNELIGSLLLGLYDDGRPAASRRRHVVVHHGDAKRAGDRARSRCGSGRSSITRGANGPRRAGAEMARMPGGQSRWSAGKDLSWEPLRIERVVRGEVRPHAGGSVPPCGDLSALAPRQDAGRLPLRSAGGHDSLRAREGVRRRRAASECPASARTADGPPLQSPDMSSSGSSASCAGRSASGTCCRLTRMRVQVRNRPRMASTSTSAGARCAAASRVASSASVRAPPAHRPFCGRGRFRSADASSVRRRDGCTRAGSPACLR